MNFQNIKLKSILFALSYNNLGRVDIKKPQTPKSNPKNSEFATPTPISKVQSQKCGNSYTFPSTLSAQPQPLPISF